MKLWVIAFCLIVLAAMVGCARSRSLIVLLPDSEGHVGELLIETRRGTIAMDKPFYAVSTVSNQAPESPRSLKKHDIEVKFENALRAEPSQRFRFIKNTFYCLKNSTELTPDSKSMLLKAIRQIITKPPLEIYVVGHADRMGTESYNQHLSHQRALSIQNELVANGSSSKIILISFLGESRPIINTPDEVEEPKNRRVEIILKYRKSE